MTPPLGWAITDNTPFAYCQYATAYGGTTNGVVIHWPKAIKANGEIRPLYHPYRHRSNGPRGGEAAAT
jgi:hypothetical protein